MPKEASIYVIPMAAIIPVDDTSYLVIVATLEGSKRTSHITFYINKRPQGFYLYWWPLSPLATR